MKTIKLSSQTKFLQKQKQKPTKSKEFKENKFKTDNDETLNPLTAFIPAAIQEIPADQKKKQKQQYRQVEEITVFSFN